MWLWVYQEDYYSGSDHRSSHCLPLQPIRYFSAAYTQGSLERWLLPTSGDQSYIALNMEDLLYLPLLLAIDSTIHLLHPFWMPSLFWKSHSGRLHWKSLRSRFIGSHHPSLSVIPGAEKEAPFLESPTPHSWGTKNSLGLLSKEEATHCNPSFYFYLAQDLRA